MKKTLEKTIDALSNSFQYAIKRISVLSLKIGPWIVFIYLYLIFRFPDFWYLIVSFLFMHYHFSSDLKDRISKYSSLFTIIAVLIVIGTYYSDKRDLNNSIALTLKLENGNNQIAVASLKDMKDGNNQGVPFRKFQVLYTKQYWYKNIDRLSDECLSNYTSYISNMEQANRFIDMLWDIQQYTIQTNNLVSVEGLDVVKQSLYKMGDWISVDMHNLWQCYKNPSF